MLLNQKLLSTLFIFLSLIISEKLLAQEDTAAEISTRFFMPALQMGYINHSSDVISEGLIIQTSLEYRAKNNLLFRLNYDDFSGRINIHDSDNNKYVAKIPLSEFIGGIGYRLEFDKHHVFALAQTGFRFYELPEVETTNGVTSILQSHQKIIPIRYTIGYEYEIIKNLFFNVETFIGHFAKKKDYWSNRKPFYGITVGLSTTLL